MLIPKNLKPKPKVREPALYPHISLKIEEDMKQGYEKTTKLMLLQITDKLKK